MPTAHLAIDLGASTGRAIVGVLDDSRKHVNLIELHRFEHQSVATPTGPVWDLGGIWNNVLKGVHCSGEYCRENQVQLCSIGMDTWGVDWALLGASGELLTMPHCYRDPQNIPAYKKVINILGGEEYLYDRTGIQLMELNTIFQVFARREAEPRLFDAAEKLIFLPDLFHYWLSGVVTVERTIASTSSMLNVESGEWDYELLRQLDIPTGLFGNISEPGTTIGPVRSEIIELTGIPSDAQVVLPASHDTGSAIAAVPAAGDSWMYLSSGTWSLLGAELHLPNNSLESFASGFTNESGINGTVRYLKNITGLWLVQELRRDHKKVTGQDLDFETLNRLANESTFSQTIIDPSEPRLSQPGDMIAKIKQLALESDQPVPQTIGDSVYCCLKSLANYYRTTIEQLEQNLDRAFDELYIVGGGAQNKLLNQLVKEATGKRIEIGPIEASATGNVLIQAWGLDSSVDIREVVRESLAASA